VKYGLGLEGAQIGAFSNATYVDHGDYDDDHDTSKNE
jgi:hypothetical protein